MGLMETAHSTCDICGDTLPEGAYFCGECGASVPEFGAPISNSERRPLTSTGSPSDVTDGRALAAATPAETAVAHTPADAMPVVTAHSYTLMFSTGERAQITGSGLIGRMPSPPTDEAFDHLIVVNDPSKTVSKTHLRVDALPEGLMVMDLDSANGTVVSMPGIAAERLAPHERVILLSGATVGIGDQSFTIQ